MDVKSIKNKKCEERRKNMKGKRGLKRIIAVMLTLAMVVTGMWFVPRMSRAVMAGAINVRNPRLYPGDITVWDCIYFGNY